MNWDRIESNWAQFMVTARGRWEKLTDDQLRTIAGKREALAASIKEAYGVTIEAAQRQVDQWQGDQKLAQGDDEKGERMASPKDGQGKTYY
jgi:uncharacterized protein YjbJ (UPF0337 family)